MIKCWESVTIYSKSKAYNQVLSDTMAPPVVFKSPSHLSIASYILSAFSSNVMFLLFI